MAVACMAGAAAATPRFAMYYDQWHTTPAPKDNTAGITHVITAFADPLLFITNPAGTYTPFVDPRGFRAFFDEGTKMCLAIGGWDFTAGFSAGQKTEETRALFASNVASTLEAHGYDCVGAY